MATYAGTDPDQGSQCAFVEGHGAFFLEDLGGAVHGTRVLSGGLQAHLDNICQLVRTAYREYLLDVTNQMVDLHRERQQLIIFMHGSVLETRGNLN